MKKLNIAELLKDCPKGMELDCSMYDNVTLISVNNGKDTVFPIRVSRGDGCLMTLTKYGQYTDAEFAKCVIFPKGKTTWEGFQNPFKDGDVVTYKLRGSLVAFIYKKRITTMLVESHFALYAQNMGFCIDSVIALKEEEIVFATEEEKQKLFDAIKANGYKWNAETKTLEKEPKFKVGDWVEYKYYKRKPEKVIRIENNVYWLSSGITVMFQDESAWDLTTNKFDITTLKTFESRVLVRTNNKKWIAAFYSHYNKDRVLHYYVIGGLGYEQCIPYNDETKHLLDTTNECDEYYKTWE